MALRSPAAALRMATTELQTRHVETKSLKETARREMLLGEKEVCESQDRAEKEADGDKGQIFGGDDKVQRKNRALMCCLQGGSSRPLFDSLLV